MLCWVLNSELQARFANPLPTGLHAQLPGRFSTYKVLFFGAYLPTTLGDSEKNRRKAGHSHRSNHGAWNTQAFYRGA